MPNRVWRKVLAHRVKTLVRPKSTVESHVERDAELLPRETPLCRLEGLPPELRTQVLSSLASLDDLKAAVHASPVLYQQYRTDRKRVLYDVLQRTLGERGFVDAFAVQQSAPLEHPPYLPRHLAAQVLMMSYKEHCSNPSAISRECTAADLVGMAAFYSGTMRSLMRRVPDKMLRNLDRSLRRGHLSSVERARFLRALYRFQLWCNLYGSSEGAVAGDRAIKFDPFDMLMYFFEVFQPWEIEEISCVYAFFMDLYYRIFVDIRWDLEEHSIRFVNTPGRSTPDGSIDLGPDMDDGAYRSATPLFNFFHFPALSLERENAPKRTSNAEICPHDR